MGDRVWASFTVGGLTSDEIRRVEEIADKYNQVPGDLRAEQVANAALACGFEGINTFPVQVDSEPVSIQFDEDQANYGDHHFNDLKELCVKLGLSYHCQWSAGSEFGTGFVWYHPKFDIEVGQDCTESGFALADSADVIAFVRACKHLGLDPEENMSVLFHSPGLDPNELPKNEALWLAMREVLTT